MENLEISRKIHLTTLKKISISKFWYNTNKSVEKLLTRYCISRSSGLLTSAFLSNDSAVTGNQIHNFFICQYKLCMNDFYYGVMPYNKCYLYKNTQITSRVSHPPTINLY